jgi:cytochrome c-type biogenesis protein
MEQWINQVFSAPEFGILVLPAGFLLGLITAFGSLACCAPIMVAVVGYAGAREDQHHKDIFLVAAFFMVGTIIALSAVGWFAGFIGQAAGGSILGMYGKIIIVALTIFFGFAALNLLPFRLPAFSPVIGKFPRGIVGASVFGLAVGGASTAYVMACCGPMMLPIVLGLSVLKGQGVWGAAILAMFAVGYSLPMVGTILGVGLGKLTGIANKAAGPIRIISGILLIGVGIWLLVTL